jgi:hypothetical protein
MSDYNFWQQHLSAGQAEAQPAQLRSDGVAYRQARRAVSASRIYDEDMHLLPEQRAAARPQLYVPGYAGLSSYTSREQVSAYAWDPAVKSAEAYARDLARKGIIDATGAVGKNAALLSEADWAAVEASVKQINERGATNADDHHAILERNASQGSGQQQLGHPVDAAMRFGHTRELEQLGALAADTSIGPRPHANASVHAFITQQEQERQPRRAAMPTGSSGEGWLTR